MKQRIASIPILVALAFLSPGCSEQKIPLFNPLARPMNRIASAREVNAEVNTQIADFVAKGWMTQEYVNKSLAPFLDPIPKLEDEAEAFLKENQTDAANSKIQTLMVNLRQVRAALAAIERSRR